MHPVNAEFQLKGIAILKKAAKRKSVPRDIADLNRGLDGDDLLAGRADDLGGKIGK
jgi:hypothetical protein